MDGAEWLEEVTEDTTVEKLKEKCLKHVGLLEVVWATLLFCRVTALPGCLLFALGVNRLQLCIYSNWVDSAIYN